MTGIVVVLIAAGALAHATWNLVVKAASLTGPAYVWMTALGSGVIVAPAAIVVAALDPPHPGLLLTAASVSAAIHVGYFLALQAGYRAGDVGVVYPLARGTGPLLSVVFAIVLFAERPGPPALLGAAAVVAGVVIIGFAGRRSDGGSARAGILWGLVTGVAIAAYTLWDAHAVQAWSMQPVVLTGQMFLFEGLLLTPFVLRSAAARASAREVARRHWRGMTVVAVLSPVSYILVLQAVLFAPVSVVAPAREVSVVLVGLAGWLLFREPHPARRLLGAAVVLGGVALLLAD